MNEQCIISQLLRAATCSIMTWWRHGTTDSMDAACAAAMAAH